MSRRSILLATTMYAVITLAAIYPASAHGFGVGGSTGGGFGGGFRGGFGGGFGHATSAPISAGIARAPMQSMGGLGGTRFGHAPLAREPAAGMRLPPAAANAAGENAALNQRFGHAQQPAQTVTPSEASIFRRPVDVGGAAAMANGPSAAAILAAHLAVARGNGDGAIARIPDTAAAIKAASANEGRGKLLRPGSDNNAPDVTGNGNTGNGKTGNGEGKSEGSGYGPQVPDRDGSDSNGPTLNLPGANPGKSGQKGRGDIPGVDTSGNGPGVNLPGSVDQHSAADAAKIISKLEQQGQDLVNQASKGGVNSLNTPTTVGSDVSSTDDDNGKNTTTTNGGNKGGGNGGNKGGNGSSGGNKGSSGSTGGNGGGNKGSGGTGGNNKGSGSGNATSVAPGLNGSTGTTKNADGSSTTVSTMQQGDTTYQVVTTRDANNKVTNVKYQEMKNGKTIELNSGPSLGGSNKTPNDSDTTGNTGSLSANSAVAKRDNGGGTDNNTMESGGQVGALSPASPVTRTGNGDGTGGDGDNNHVSNDGTLAAGSALARKNYGDGGDSDSRGGGGTSVIGKLRAGPNGGSPHQSAAASRIGAD